MWIAKSFLKRIFGSKAMRIIFWVVIGVAAIIAGLISTMGLKGLLWLPVVLVVVIALLRIDAIDKD